MRKLFPNQLEGEKVYLIVRQHWFVFFKKVLIWLLFAFMLLLFRRFGAQNVPGLFEGEIGEVTRLFMQVYTLFLILSLFIIWLLYYLNVQIITDKRIIDIDQVGLFFHEVSELHIENIEDVTSDVSGLLGTLFNYGMVYVQTAASKERFEFDLVPNPSDINKLLLKIYKNLPHYAKHGKD